MRWRYLQLRTDQGDIVYQKVTCVDMHSFVHKLYYFVESG
jgi:hypothetical protein